MPMKFIYYFIFLYNFSLLAAYNFHKLPNEIYLHIINTANSLEDLDNLLNLSLTNKKLRKIINDNSQYIIKSIINSRKLKLSQSRFFIQSCTKNCFNIIKLFFSSGLSAGILDINFIHRFCDLIRYDKSSHKYVYMGNASTTLLLLQYIVKSLVFAKHILNPDQIEYMLLFRLAIKLCDQQIIKLYIDTGIDVNREYWGEDGSPMIEAIYSNKIKIIKQMLSAGGIINTEICPSIAMKANNLNAVKFLVKNGLDIEYLLFWESIMLVLSRSGRLHERTNNIADRLKTINYLKAIKLEKAQNTNIVKEIKSPSCCFIM